MIISDFHAKYYAHDLTLKNVDGSRRLSRELFDAQVDLNPHQIEAALFALNSPLSKGVILADEVGLGKTIEAGIILCQLWAERKRRILVIGPAAIRKQWALELMEKFNLPSTVLDARGYKELQLGGNPRPLDQKRVIVVSFHFANRYKEEIRSIPWDIVVIDEAHKLRNAYRQSNRIGQGIRWAVEDRRKILLTATPLQNSLLELYGLSTLIDDLIFGDRGAFRSRHMNAGANVDELRQRLAGFCKRTLRKDVTEYVAERLEREAKRHAEATISRSLDANSKHFIQARECLERWAEDSVLAAEQSIRDTKEQIKGLRRQSRQAETLSEQKELQEKIQSLEKKQRRQRQQIFDGEDEINDKRDTLIAELERRLSQKTQSDELLTIRWRVV